MRNPDTTKHDYGHALIVAGAYGRMGCAILAARAALRSGCGLVSVHLPQRCVAPMQAAFPEAMVSIDPDECFFTQVPLKIDSYRYSVVAVGPGIGYGDATQEAFLQLLKVCSHYDVPLVLDADALGILALHPEWLEYCSGAILTPHEGEYRRLFADADPAVVAMLHNVVIVRKSHFTHVYSPTGRIYVNQTGNAGMATAGCGDVLTGIIAGMSACLDLSSYEVACRAVELHGKLGDMCIEKQSESSLVASDLIENLRYVNVE